MPTLLIRHGYGTRFVSEKHTELVPLAGQNGQQHYARFAGFIEQSESVVWSVLARVKKVKINNVYGFGKTDGYFDVTYYGGSVVALGYYSMLNKTVTIPLLEGMPLVWCELKVIDSANHSTQHTNVVDLFPGNGKRSNT